jgi:flagellum-specific peptidoglycan hydrolase FlgJ
MIKKTLLFAFVLFIVSCGSNKSIIVTKKGTGMSESAYAGLMKSGAKNKDGSSIELEATSKVRVTTEVVNAYINQYKDIAQKNMAQFGIPSSITLAQGILESGAGTAGLSVSANNHFGIKCHKDWTGPSVRYDDDLAQECFRKYDVPSESFKDHSLFLTGRTWYAPLFKLEKTDYKGWAKGLKSAGYATDPKYANKLIALIEKYGLSQFDDLSGSKKPTTSGTTNSKGNTSSTEYRVEQGDTLYSISRKFNLTIDELKKKNNLNENAVAIGQTLKVN